MGYTFVAILAGMCSKEAMAMTVERLANFSDEVTEGRISVMVE